MIPVLAPSDNLVLRSQPTHGKTSISYVVPHIIFRAESHPLPKQLNDPNQLLGTPPLLISHDVANAVADTRYRTKLNA
jgi:hypothetical protein